MNQDILKMLQSRKERNESAVSIVSGVWMDSLSPDKEAELIGIFDMQKIFNENFPRMFLKATGIAFEEIEIEGTRMGSVLVTESQYVLGKGIVSIKRPTQEEAEAPMVRGGTRIGTFQRAPLTLEEVYQRLDNLVSINIDERDIQQIKDCLEGATLDQRLVVIPPTKIEPEPEMDTTIGLN